MQIIQFSKSSRAVLTGLLGGFAVAAMVVATVALTPNPAMAKPEYAAQTKLPCAGCHTNPAGGGALNSKGKKFQSNGHKL